MQEIIQGGVGSPGIQGKKEILCRACRLGEIVYISLLLSSGLVSSFSPVLVFAVLFSSTSLLVIQLLVLFAFI
jgi:hypothetical protein